MTTPVVIKDGKGNGNEAIVTSRGQLITAPLEYSSFYNVKAELINVGYNLIVPKKGMRFVLTDIVLYANKNVGVGDATVDLYEATSSTSITISRSIINQEMVKQTTLPLTGLNVICSEGRWINIKTDDDDIFANVAGYYVKA